MREREEKREKECDRGHKRERIKTCIVNKERAIKRGKERQYEDVNVCVCVREIKEGEREKRERE